MLIIKFSDITEIWILIDGAKIVFRLKRLFFGFSSRDNKAHYT